MAGDNSSSEKIAAQSLKEQAVKLAEAVSVFKLSRNETRQVIAQAQTTARASVAPARAARAAKPAARIEPKQLATAEKGGEDWTEF